VLLLVFFTFSLSPFSSAKMAHGRGFESQKMKKRIIVTVSNRAIPIRM
jgi:hypothetical protein